MTLRDNSIESTDSGMYILTGKGFSYPPLIFTDPEFAANIPDSDTTDSVTVRPRISNYVGDYCEKCLIKWSRCICKPESDWDDDQNYKLRTQTDSPPNEENRRHPIPSDWSDQEDFWNGKAFKRVSFTQHK